MIKEVYSGCSGFVDLECFFLLSFLVYKVELEKKLFLERFSLDGEGVVENGIIICNGKE